MNVQIEDSWKAALEDEFDKKYFGNIVEFLKIEKEQKKVIYPPGNLIFNAFQQTPFDKVKVVMLGQDPYHGPGQAMGLCFSVPDGILPPPSLVNMYKELHSDIGMPIPKTGNLLHWAQQGVFMLNATLTVRASEANSHSKIGWGDFTDAVIKTISDKKTGVIFLLWGKFAQSKEVFIDKSKHFILKAAHPSPLSAYNGFFGCKHFSKTNELLTKQGFSPIDWQPASL
ncbi:MAG: uracil-DNA glycosylase [Pseudopedobacter saltans]|uniref:Uracil-DNA glycosylase n=1 Tax=Pseudopedobacter saltans TaxID=151895 RepID=A0A2W5EXW0_9SPHI|nr:MAG: uracil-DNA glycosylase [Pseudopedobacter saltans]